MSVGPQTRPAGAPSSPKPQGQPQDGKVCRWGAACRFAGGPPAGKGSASRWGLPKAREEPGSKARSAHFEEAPGPAWAAAPCGSYWAPQDPAQPRTPAHRREGAASLLNTLLKRFTSSDPVGRGTQTGGRPDARWEAVGMAGPRPACLCLSFPSRNAEFMRFPPGSEILMWSSKWSEKTLVGQGTGTGWGGGGWSLHPNPGLQHLHKPRAPWGRLVPLGALSAPWAPDTGVETK